MNYRIRALEYGDIEWLRLLRNSCRDRFFDKREITAEQQEQWWRAVQWGDERWIISYGQAGQVSDEPVGYFSIINPKPDLPIFPTDGRPVRYFSTMMVAPEWRGKGVIQTAQACFDTKAHCYVGYVKAENDPSLKACNKLGFRYRGFYCHESCGNVVIVWKA